jgi:hypothetical protein
MSKQELVEATTKLTGEMVDFENKRDQEIEAFYTEKMKIHREPDAEKRAKLDMDIEGQWLKDNSNFQSEYRKNYLNRASALRDELLFRLRMTPEQSERAVEEHLPSTSQFLGGPMLGGPISRALAGALVGPHPIADAAMYLEGLARLLQ